MAPENGNVGDLDGCSSSEQATHQKERKPNTIVTGNPNYDKVLAQRALLGSRKRRGKSRKMVNHEARSLPSRLSKVSLADESVD
ncbi:hypothetical protein Tsubulata_032782 [Turnera subulata]|uniref:Uncharacterized protein n=1 Tax=Turnera subulata TaxID=218843 RepID=A0A9Q0GER4_9ROSI|nr:hypothetical protein Tsubulata_032782 [Turnera subulata]